MRRGFTLLELIMVIVIIGILAIIAVPRLITNIENARQAEALSTMNAIREVERAYFSVYTVYTNAFPMTVDLDGDGTLEYNLATPPTTNFTYTVPSTDATTGYIQAARLNATSGRNSYGMCITSGKTSKCLAAACNPGCP